MTREQDLEQLHHVDVHVGKRIRELRRQMRISQSQLGAALGISFQQIQKYERATNRVSASKLYETADVLGVSVMEFFAGLPKAEPATLNPLFARLARDGDFRRLALLFDGLATPEGRRKLVDAVELLAG